jgi:flagellar motor component MotA
VGVEVAKRAVAWGVAVLSLFVFLVLAGVAVMMGVMQSEFHWVLVVVPAAALVVSLGAWSVARKRLPTKAFMELKAQIDADAQALRTVRAR